MTPSTNLVVVGDGILAAGNVMRIVATGAAQLPLAIQTTALQKALGFPKSVARLRDFEAGILTRRTIEGHLEVCQGLSRQIRERSAIEADDGLRKLLIRCFQVALQANLHLAIRIQARRVHNGGSHRLRRSAV